MHLNNIFECNSMRSFVKNLSMGNFMDLLLKTNPLSYEMNKRGSRSALINCNIFDGIHPELKSFDILKYLTSVNAMIHGLTDRGNIQPGKLADLVCVEGNPLDNISILNEVLTVIKGGIFLKHEGKELYSAS